MDPSITHIPMFGKENKMHPTPVPACLTDLNNVEIEAIRMISPQTSIYCRKGGKLGHTGNVIGFENDLQPLCTVLPKLTTSEEFRILTIQTSDKDKFPLRVRHQKVLDALIYLQEHNPAYKDIQISQENLA